MNKRRLTGLLCTAILLAGLFAACGGSDTDQNLTAPTTRAEAQQTQATTTAPETFNTQAGTYWKTEGFDGAENDAGDYWSDLFLWADGTGYFRFSQATPAGHFYGIHDITACDWSLDGGVLTLFSPGTKTVLYTGSVAGEALTLHYDGYTSETISMGQADMPPYGAQWILSELYGTWQMTGYTDAAGRHHTVGGYFASEITIDPVIGVYFWVAEPTANRFELAGDVSIGTQEHDTWQPYARGPIWAGCVNEAWHVELTGSADPNVQFFATYADGKLLLSKADSRDPNRYPASFTAEFEYVGHPADLGDDYSRGSVQTRFAEQAYAPILDEYRYAFQQGGDVDTVTDHLVSFLEDAAQVDAQQPRALAYSLDEPMRSGSPIGYAIRDINEDGIPELFILTQDGDSGDETINALFTLRGGETALVDAYWSRNSCTLAADGTLYIDSSSGADSSTSAAYRLSAQTGTLIKALGGTRHDVTAAEAGLFFTLLTDAPAGSASGAAAVYPFTSIVGYQGKVYSLYAAPEIPNFAGVHGSDKLTPLPKAIGTRLESEGLYVYSFTLYQDKIYYLAAEPGSDITPGAVYRCNMDGSQNEKLADAYNYATCMLSDGWLYFDIEADWDAPEVFKLDLSDTGSVQPGAFPTDIEPGIVDYQGFYYYFSDGTLYKKDGQTEAVSAIQTLESGPTNTYGDGYVMAVVNDTIYYATSGEYSENGNTFLFGVSIHGGTGELLASWFVS